MVSMTRMSFGARVLGRIVPLGLAVLAAAPAFAARPKDPVGSALPNQGAWDAFLAGRGGATFDLVLYGL